MKKLKHENIVNILGHGYDGIVVKPSGRDIRNLTYIVMDYINGDLLFDFVKDFGGIGEDNARVLMTQLVQVL
jgi:serine/threonine protein kinase